MQKFFEMEELHPKERDWTNRSGNGDGTVAISGTFVWTPADDDDADKDQAPGAKGDARGGAEGVKGGDAEGTLKVPPPPKMAAIAPVDNSKTDHTAIVGEETREN